MFRFAAIANVADQARSGMELCKQGVSVRDRSLLLAERPLGTLVSSTYEAWPVRVAKPARKNMIAQTERSRMRTDNSDVESINIALEEFLGTLRANDLDGIVESYTPDAVVMPPGHQALK